MKLYVALGVGLCIAASSGTAHADDVPGVGVLLVDPVRLAQWLADRDPVIESARDKVVAASELGDQARVRPNPQLTIGAGGFVLGYVSALHLAYKQCNGSCGDEKALMALSLVGFPIAGGWLGYQANSRTPQDVIYLASNMEPSSHEGCPP